MADLPEPRHPPTDRDYMDSRLADLQAQLDRRIVAQAEQTEHLRDETEARVRAAADSLNERLKAGDDQLSAHIQAQESAVAAALVALNEQLDHRERAVLLHHATMEKAVEVASSEREKSAAALRLQLSQQIDQGDKALREHIEQQVSQLRNMLTASSREIDLRADAQAKAIEKSETAYDKRFASVNELRGQMGDLIASHQKAISDITAALMPREVAEAKIADLEKSIRQNTSRIDQAGGKEMGVERRQAASQFTTTTLIAVVSSAVAFLGLIIVAANSLTGG